MNESVIEKMPIRAEMLLKILKRYCGKNSYCWPSRGKLAEELGIAAKTVSFWLAHLRDIGLIEIERTGRSNNYWIPPRSDVPQSRTLSSRNQEVRCATIENSEFPKSRTVVADPIYEFNSMKGESSPTLESAIPEHPEVAAILEGMDEFDAAPLEERRAIEARVRQEAAETPLYAWDDWTFKAACANALKRKGEENDTFEADWMKFREDFIKFVPGCPKNDLDFLDRVKVLFGPPGLTGAKGISATGEEMAYALNAYLDDPRRLERRGNQRWEGVFARSAYMFLPDYIIKYRQRKARPMNPIISNPEPRNDAPTPVLPVLPTAPPDETLPFVNKLRELIGEGRYALWFNGKATFRLGKKVLEIGVMNEFLRQWIETNFREELKKAARKFGNGTKAIVVVRGSEEKVEVVNDH